MSDLTEADVVNQMKHSLREAGQAAVDLSIRSRKGPAYKRLREHLLLVEGCCRQLSAMREDARWTNIGMAMAQAHKMAGDWLRGFKHPVTGQRIQISIHQKNPLFVKLAENLAFLHETTEDLLNKRTGKVGKILPSIPNIGRRVGAPIAVKLPGDMQIRDSGLIVPKTMQ